MAVLYVAALYAPTFILPIATIRMRRRRLPYIATALHSPGQLADSRCVQCLWLEIGSCLASSILPLSLTSLMYAGSFTDKILKVIDSCKEHQSRGENVIVDFLKSIPRRFINWIYSMASELQLQRNWYSELACCPYFYVEDLKLIRPYFLCPVLFSLAHINHMLELYIHKDYRWLKAFMAVGFQLAYTVVFGSYACFLFVRTGHLIAPLIAHIFCNYMGLPVILSRKSGLASLGFIAGFLAFIWLLFPLTSSDLYNHPTQSCKCWHRLCT